MGYIYNGELGYRLERKEEKRRTTKFKKKKIYYTGRVGEKENEEAFPE